MERNISVIALGVRCWELDVLDDWVKGCVHYMRDDSRMVNSALRECTNYDLGRDLVPNVLVKAKAE